MLLQILVNGVIQELDSVLGVIRREPVELFRDLICSLDAFFEVMESSMLFYSVNHLRFVCRAREI